MGEDHRSVEEATALRILVYLKEHPQAKDTIEGISQWWLAGEGPCRISEIERALTGLLARDLIVSSQRPGLRWYAVNPAKLEEISRILIDG